MKTWGLPTAWRPYAAKTARWLRCDIVAGGCGARNHRNARTEGWIFRYRGDRAVNGLRTLTLCPGCARRLGIAP